MVDYNNAFGTSQGLFEDFFYILLLLLSLSLRGIIYAYMVLNVVLYENIQWKHWID